MEGKEREGGRVMEKDEGGRGERGEREGERGMEKDEGGRGERKKRRELV